MLLDRVELSSAEARAEKKRWLCWDAWVNPEDRARTHTKPQLAFIEAHGIPWLKYKSSRHGCPKRWKQLCSRTVPESGTSKSWNSLHYIIPVQNTLIAFFWKHVLQSSFGYLYWEWTFAEQMGSQHFSNHTIALSAFEKSATRNIKSSVVKSVPTFFTNVKSA